MKYLVFPSTQCLEDAKQFGLAEEVKKLQNKVARDQCIANWDTFLPSPYVKKSLGNSHRLVAAVQPLHDYIFVCLLRIFVRSDSQYHHFLINPSAAHLTIPEAAKLQAFADNLKEPPVSTPPPSALEVEYLHLVSEDYLDESEGVVYESWDWTELAGRPQFRDLSIRYYDLLVKEILSVSDADKAAKTECYTNEVGLLYRYYADQRRLFLIAPLTPPFDSQLLHFRNKYSSFLNNQQYGVAEEELLKRSGRSYPIMVFLADRKVWSDIENNSDGNLALSPEEFTIMETVLHPNSTDGAFPLFINGGPGSGKSTILQYLFAEYLYSYLRKAPGSRLPFPPLYLTYSGKLLEAARRSVETIFRCNSKKSLSKIDVESQQSRQALDRSFMEFHKLILHDLLPRSAQAQFPLQRRVDFRTFRSLYDREMRQRPDAGLRRLSAELSWHVIRTYIKGMREDPETEFDVEAYAELPVKQRTVDAETFATVFAHVWKWYRRLSTKNLLWDDQDLARFALDSQVDLARYSAVFCDEAQDFTKIELELIQQLSFYSKRSISPQELHRIPFGFAGDPFQTLNPTGFNWSAVQAGFHEKILQSLDPLGRSHLKFNYRPLGFNYRSTQNIVGFCNVIQLLRGILFDKKDLACQKSWLSEDSAMPVYFDVQDASCQRNLRAETDIVIILPCQEGEENDYVAADAYLTEMSRGASRNFFSPMRAKGLEFSRVVLYKFGDECVHKYPDLLKPLDTGVSHAQHPEAALPLEYFMNRLYVASSRAKKRLIVIDTEEANKKFWGHECFQNLSLLLSKYPEARAKRYGWSIEQLSFIQRGSESSWSEDRDDPVQLAELFVEDGKSQHDPYKLEKAEAIFRRLGRESEALECRALQYEFRGAYKKAGEAYLDLRQVKDALRCFWKGKAYASISASEYFHDTIEQRLSNFMVGDKGPSECVAVLEFLAEAVAGVQKDRIMADENVGTICDYLVNSLMKTASATSVFCGDAFARLLTLKQAGVQMRAVQEMGELAFRAGEYENAIAIWNDLSADARPTHYQDAQAEMQIAEWQAPTIQARSTVSPSSAAEAYIRRRKYQEAAKVLYWNPDEAAIERLLGLIADEKNVQTAALASLVKAKCGAQKWAEALDIASGKRKSSADYTRLRNVFLLEVAQSSHLLTETSPSEIERIRDYLRRNAIEGKWDRSADVFVAGAAIEKADRILDSLSFYEMVQKKEKFQFSNEETAFARARWVKCKDRQALRSDERNQRESAVKYTKEAEEAARRWGISLLDIPDYPVISEKQKLGLTKALFSDDEVTIDDKAKAFRALTDSGLSPEKAASLLGLSVEELKAVQHRSAAASTSSA